ncbi:hypothetical protein SUGI_1085430 [Cryptomeria japonica]|nr:hypothetical protein SUGI_1085430 [Cryptomeria japonica]
MPLTTRQARKRGRGPRRVRIAHEEVEREASVPEENPGAPPEQPNEPNRDLLAAIQILIGIVQERIPAENPQVRSHDSGSHRSIDRERSKSPAPIPIESQGGNEPESVHMPGPPPVVEPVYFERARRDPGDLIKEVMRLQPPSFGGSIDGVEAEAWLLSLERCFALRSYESNLKARVAVHLLRGTASTWWRQEEYKCGLVPDTLT